MAARAGGLRDRPPEPPRSAGSGGRRVRARRAAALIALALGLAGFAVSAAGVAVQVLPRQFTAASSGRSSRGRSAPVAELTAGQIFPATVTYQLLRDRTSGHRAARPGRDPGQHRARSPTAPRPSPPRPRRGAAQRRVRGDAPRHLRGLHPELRHDRRRGRAAQRRGDASAESLSRPAGRGRQAAPRPAAGPASWWSGTAARRPGYDYHRQLSGSFADGPYLVMYAAGYADGRPRVPVPRTSTPTPR